MAEEKMRKGKKRKGAAPKNGKREVHLAPVVDFIHEHLTEALCGEVVQAIRTTERERKWSLFALARFWLAVIFDAPPSLSNLLERARGTTSSDSCHRSLRPPRPSSRGARAFRLSSSRHSFTVS